MQFLVNITRLAGSEQDSTHAALSFLLYGGNAVASEVESRALRQFHVELIVRCSRAKGSGWLAAAVSARGGRGLCCW